MKRYEILFTTPFVGLPNGLAFTPDGSSVLLGTNERTPAPNPPFEWAGRLTEFWLPPQTHKRERTVDLPFFEGFDLHPQANLIAVYGLGGLRVLDFSTGNCERAFHNSQVDRAAFVPGHNILVISKGSTGLASVNLDNELWSPHFQLLEVTTAISVHPDGKTILVSSGAQGCFAVAFFELDSSAGLRESGIKGGTSTFDGGRAVFSPDGQLFACVDAKVEIYRFPTMELVAAFDGNGKLISGNLDEWDESSNTEWSNPVFSSDSRTLICESPTGAILFWDVEESRVVYELEGHGDASSVLATDPNGQLLASAGGDGVLKVWKRS